MLFDGKDINCWQMHKEPLPNSYYLIFNLRFIETEICIHINKLIKKIKKIVTLYCDSNGDFYSITLLITLLIKRAKIYIFHCYKSLGVRDKHRLKTKKKLLDRKTEEVVSLAQNSSRSDLTPLWCKAPNDINPPVPSPS